MPTAPGRICACGAVVVSGRCPRCRATLDTRRGVASLRGYDQAWRRLRDRHLAARPLCALCARAYRVTAAVLVDHVVPFDGPGDPRRLDPQNLQSLCRACHADNTWTEQHGEK